MEPTGNKPYNSHYGYEKIEQQNTKKIVKKITKFVPKLVKNYPNEKYFNKLNKLLCKIAPLSNLQTDIAQIAYRDYLYTCLSAKKCDAMIQMKISEDIFGLYAIFKKSVTENDTNARITEFLTRNYKKQKGKYWKSFFDKCIKNSSLSAEDKEFSFAQIVAILYDFKALNKTSKTKEEFKPEHKRPNPSNGKEEEPQYKRPNPSNEKKEEPQYKRPNPSNGREESNRYVNEHPAAIALHKKIHDLPTDFYRDYAHAQKQQQANILKKFYTTFNVAFEPNEKSIFDKNNIQSLLSKMKKELILVHPDKIGQNSDLAKECISILMDKLVPFVKGIMDSIP